MSIQNAKLILKELYNETDNIDSASVEKLTELLNDSKTIFASASGRSGLMIKAVLMRLMHMGKRCFVVGEIVTPSAQSGDTLLLGSGSGETAVQVAIAKKAKKIGMKIALITIDKNSTLGKLADVVVEIPAPTPKMENGGKGKSIQPMGSMFEQSMLILLEGIICDLMVANNIKSKDMYINHANLE